MSPKDIYYGKSDLEYRRVLSQQRLPLKNVTSSTYTIDKYDGIIYFDNASNNITATLPPLADVTGQKFYFRFLNYGATLKTTITTNGTEYYLIGSNERSNATNNKDNGCMLIILAFDDYWYVEHSSDVNFT